MPSGTTGGKMLNRNFFKDESRNMKFLLLLCVLGSILPASAVKTELSGDMTICVNGKSFSVKPPEMLVEKAEKHLSFPLFNPAKAWYLSGTNPRKSTFHSLVTMRISTTPGGTPAEAGRDYLFSIPHNRVGLAPGSRLSPPVYLDYEYLAQRIDSVVESPTGTLEYRSGIPSGLTPRMPELVAGEKRILNVFLPPGCKKLSRENLYPVETIDFPKSGSTAAERIPQSLAKLRNGEPLRILAWGDSVTEGYRELNSADRWQEQFVRHLQERFPQAKIQLITNGWGGHNSDQFLNAPKSDARHHYPDRVLGQKPDLVISEFVNDSWYDAKRFARIYPRLLHDFRAANIEWIIVAPHHIKAMRNVDGEDSRPYVQMLREFTRTNRIALADVSDRYSRLYRLGIPFLTLFVNDYNHPDARGMKIYADTLMALFPEK